jgi:hypothetical protein
MPARPRISLFDRGCGGLVTISDRHATENADVGVFRCRHLTEAMVAIEGENMRSVTWVMVEEVKSGDWGIGGKPLITADVKALAAG